jgi:MFS transporter, OCT family, solute carrier family 22 (organic cation transporter), member 4/5
MCRASVLFLCWFTATITYYGLGFSAGDMAGGLYANSIALSAVDIPGNLLYAIFANRPSFGRRYTQAVFFGLGGFCLLVVPVAKAAFGYVFAPEVAKGFAIAGKLTAAGVFNGVYVYAAEIFPTTVRSTGLGCCNIFARVGGILAPQALQLGPDTMAALFGGLAVASGVATLMLPETLGRVLE